MTFEFTPTDDGFRIQDTIENAWSDGDLHWLEDISADELLRQLQ